MNEFQEINILTSRGDINGALSLIGKWSESIARKTMKKGGLQRAPTCRSHVLDVGAGHADGFSPAAPLWLQSPG